MSRTSRLRADAAKNRERLLLAAGAADGTLRSDIEPDDIAVNLAGIVLATVSTDPLQMGRLLDLLMDALGSAPHGGRS